jgi:hypothetical protein
MALQTLPPESLHDAPFVAGIVPQLVPKQVGVRHNVGLVHTVPQVPQLVT